MTAQFRLTEPAIQDIEQIADYIARQSGLNQGDHFQAKFPTISQQEFVKEAIALLVQLQLKGDKPSAWLRLPLFPNIIISALHGEGDRISYSFTADCRFMRHSNSS
ncbi:MAG: type II toxin-antitoxin system RelE/ParE family toxin [Cyanobacteriota bacterium]|nr:type II toxin-antitoxin system RelE/ParE family toxin [Cyanobacteriota bacterium]